MAQKTSCEDVATRVSRFARHIIFFLGGGGNCPRLASPPHKWRPCRKRLFTPQNWGVGEIWLHKRCMAYILARNCVFWRRLRSILRQNRCGRLGCRQLEE